MKISQAIYTAWSAISNLHCSSEAVTPKPESGKKAERTSEEWDEVFKFVLPYALKYARRYVCNKKMSLAEAQIVYDNVHIAFVNNPQTLCGGPNVRMRAAILHVFGYRLGDVYRAKSRAFRIAVKVREAVQDLCEVIGHVPRTRFTARQRWALYASQVFIDGGDLIPAARWGLTDQDRELWRRVAYDKERQKAVAVDLKLKNSTCNARYQKIRRYLQTRAETLEKVYR